MVLQIAEAPVTQTCCHHWMIRASEGPVSLGVCKHCFETREFKNSIFDMERDSHDLSNRLEPVAREANGAGEE